MVCFGNTHLYSHPEFPDVKLWQCHQLLHWLEGITNNNLPLVLCGDFNSEPSSAVYELVSQQVVSPDHPDLRADTTDLLRGVLMSDHHSISHNLLLKSAYAAMLGEEPKFTNYTVGYVGVLDYIWLTAMHWRPLTIAPIPDENELGGTGEALPNALYPSDHLMLFADLQYGGGGPGGGGAPLAGGLMGDLRNKGLPGLGGTPTKQPPPNQSPLMSRKGSIR